MLLTSLFGGFLFQFTITITVILIAFWRRARQHWQRHNVPSLEPPSLLTKIHSMFVAPREHPALGVKRQYDEIKRRGWKHGGIYGLLFPIYLTTDLDYLRNIMVKDFRYFADRGVYHNIDSDPLSAHVGNLTGAQWRNMRIKLTPTFTSGKLKKMFDTLVSCEANLIKKIEQDRERKVPIQIKTTLECFTTDIVGSCAFGLECNTFEKEDSPFRVYGSKFFDRSRARTMIRDFADAFPKLSSWLHIASIPDDITKFFVEMVEETVSYREKNNVVRNDFLQLLIDLKNNKLEDDEGKLHGIKLSIKEITAQSFVFFAAGLETSSTGMSFALYELGRNPALQDKLRAEIKEILGKYQGKITYDGIQEMKYLNQVVNESLRKYPPAPNMKRRCVETYRVPGTDAVIEKGVTALIPIYAVHHDPEHYPEPDKFDPERFNEKNNSLRHSLAFIPFGEGPRLCIGMRFGLMQMKVGLVSLLSNYRFTVNPKTKEPLQMRPDSFVFAAEGGIWLDAHKDA